MCEKMDGLYIEMKVKGKPETLTCFVPDIHKEI